MLFNVRVVALCAIYVVSGAFIALTSQWQKYQGMNVQSGILIIATYIAEIMSFGATFTERVEPRFCKPRLGDAGKVVAQETTRKPATFHPVMIVIALVDVVALAVTSLGTQTGVLLWTSGCVRELHFCCLFFSGGKCRRLVPSTIMSVVW